MYMYNARTKVYKKIEKGLPVNLYESLEVLQIFREKTTKENFTVIKNTRVALSQEFDLWPLPRSVAVGAHE